MTRKVPPDKLREIRRGSKWSDEPEDDQRDEEILNVSVDDLEELLPPVVWQPVQGKACAGSGEQQASPGDRDGIIGLLAFIFIAALVWGCLIWLGLSAGPALLVTVIWLSLLIVVLSIIAGGGGKMSLGGKG